MSLPSMDWVKHTCSSGEENACKWFSMLSLLPACVHAAYLAVLKCVCPIKVPVFVCFAPLEVPRFMRRNLSSCKAQSGGKQCREQADNVPLCASMVILAL